MKKYILILFNIILWYNIQSQPTSVHIKIIDAQDKFPLMGVGILNMSNDKMLFSTDKNGEVSINCQDSLKVKIFYLGYKTIVKTIFCFDRYLTLELQPDEHQLETVEITSTSNPNKSQLEQPYSISRVDNYSLKRLTGLFLDDAINTNVPGVMMERRTVSAGQQINIRGYGAGMGVRGVNNNFDNQGIKVYYNGIPITDAEGITVLDDIDYKTVHNTEILKGPSGTLYGLAIAGVINLKTETAPKNKILIGQDVMSGSYGLLRTTTRVGIGGENSSVMLSYGHQTYDGFMPHTSSQKDFVNMTGDFRLSDKQKVSSYLGYTYSYDQRNGELTQLQYDTLNYTGNPAYIKNNAHSAYKTIRAGISHQYQITKNISNTSIIFGTGQISDASSAGGWTDKNAINYGFRSVFDKMFQLSEKIKLTGITGIEYQRNNALVIGYGMGVDSTNISGYNVITKINSNQSVMNTTYSYFTQWSLFIPWDISLTAGLGVNNMNIRLEDRLWGLNNNKPNNTKAKVYQTNYDNLLSPNFAINKKINDNASVYASYAVGYKAPVSSNILISTTGKVNTNLKPEKGTQIEIGTKGSWINNKLFYTIAVFQTIYQNKFTSVAVPNPNNTVTLYSYLVNGGNLNNKGLEISVYYKLIESDKGFIKLLQPFANFTYNDFKYENFSYQSIGKTKTNKDTALIFDYSGKQVAGFPPRIFNAGIDIITKMGLYANIIYNYRSAMPYTSDGLNNTKAYSLLNGKIGLKRSIKKFDVDVYFGANNITSVQYYNMVFVNQLPDAYIPAPNKINYFGGFSMRYVF